MKDSHGDRMKYYEKLSTCIFESDYPLCVRLDGRNFSKLTRKLDRPFDAKFIDFMGRSTRFLLEEYNSDIAYCESDEISLIWLKNFPFDGKSFKIISGLSSSLTSFVNRDKEAMKLFGDKHINFDCRAWAVPNISEAVNVIVWRYKDAKRNSISMAARAVMSHSEVNGLNSRQKVDILRKKYGIIWNEYPSSFKHGQLYRRVKKTGKFMPEELNKLPKLHDARKNPDLEVTRTVIERIPIIDNFSAAEIYEFIFDLLN
jgi:tRNA(His) guanylyltransferase